MCTSHTHTPQNKILKSWGYILVIECFFNTSKGLGSIPSTIPEKKNHHHKIKDENRENTEESHHLCIKNSKLAKSMHASFCVIKDPNSISFAKVLLCLMNSHDFLRSGIINSSEILEGLFFFLMCCKRFHASCQRSP